MKVIVCAGGTGGHIYPALAIINKIKEKEPNSTFLYIGTHNRMEKDLIPSMGIDFIPLTITGFKRKISMDNINTIKYFFKAIKESKRIIKKFNPDVVIGAGGYVTGPVIYAAKKLKYKTFIHEQNSVPGLANRFLNRYADKIGVSFKESAKYFKGNKTIYTGNPRSEEALSVKPMTKKELGVLNNRKLVIIVMGSLGANRVNEFMIEVVPKFKDKNYDVIYLTGDKYYEDIITKINIPNNVQIKPYVESLTRVLKATDVIVTRAGATTLSEVTALGIPSIIIPSPYVPNDHQTKNALELAKAKAAILMEEANLNADDLINNIDNIINNKVLHESMKKNSFKLGIKDSATKIYNILKELVK